jgi:hypothetical protein
VTFLFGQTEGGEEDNLRGNEGKVALTPPPSLAERKPRPRPSNWDPLASVEVPPFRRPLLPRSSK